MPSLAADTREAVLERPFLRTALRAGVVSYAAAARFLASDLNHGDTDAIVTALRRFEDDLPAYDETACDVRVTMHSGLSEADDSADALFSLGETSFVAGSGSLTGVLAEGDLGASATAHALNRLLIADVEVLASGFTPESLLVVVPRRDGANALRAMESALDAVPL